MATKTGPAALPFYFNGHRFDQTNIGDGKLTTPKAGSYNYILVGCKQSLGREQEHKLESSGAGIVDFSGRTTFVCKYNAATLAPIRSLPFVSSANIYPQNLVVHPTVMPFILKARDAQGNAFDAQHRFRAIIHLHEPAEGDGTRIRGELAKLIGLGADDIFQEGSNHLRVALRRQDFDAAAAHNEVQTIALVPGNVFSNYVARKDLNVPIPDNNNNNAELGRQGRGIVVALTDTGFDVGDIKNLHPAFTAGQIVALKSFYAGELKAKWDERKLPVAGPDTGDRYGHGTHIAGSIVGNGISKTFGPVQGTAPGALLYIQSVGGPNQEPRLYECGLTLSQVFTSPLAARAYIHSVSWNTNMADNIRRGYIDETRVTDEIVWNNKQLLIVHGAGNDGRGYIDRRSPQINEPDRPKRPRTWAHVDGKAIAKNILTVGATESTRPVYKLYDPYLPIEDETVAEEALIRNYSYYNDGKKPALNGSCYNVAAFSSCGPAKAPGAAEDDEVPGNADDDDEPKLENILRHPGRNKPDLVAPGDHIYSALSRHSELKLDKLFPRASNDPPQNNFDYYGTSPSADGGQYIFFSGTSHSTPLVAGCAAVISEALAPADQDRPPASAIKAVLVNNTLDLSATGKNKRGPLVGPAPDGAQGYGLIDLQSALENVENNQVGKVICNGGPLTERGSESYKINLYSKSVLAPQPITLSVTLVWTDFPHEEIVNSLRLKVTDSKKNWRLGNIKKDNPDVAQYDEKNNVQKVEWDNIPVGLTLIEVDFPTRRVIAGNPDSQEFSLVWHVRNGNYKDGWGVET
ncbi:peptidase S8/S53 domain-containing protein [Hypomontagnella monticulosa]|nr:peptidase S8/S53 domain-containing protein [Hypomontagnella monticulosa]